MQQNRKIIALLFSFGLCASPCNSKTERLASQTKEFRRANPCPSTGRKTGPCPGWQVDHIQPLCAKGADKPENMQWLTVEQHKKKTRIDVKTCRNSRI